MLLGMSRKEGGCGDGRGQWHIVWQGLCHHSVTEKMTPFSVKCSNFIEGPCMEEKGRGSFLHITSWVPPNHPPLEPTALQHTASQLSDYDSPLIPSRAQVQLPELCTNWLPFLMNHLHETPTSWILFISPWSSLYFLLATATFSGTDVTYVYICISQGSSEKENQYEILYT